MNLNLRKKFSQQLLLAKRSLDDQANEILDDVIARCEKPTIMKLIDESVSFKGPTTTIAFGHCVGLIEMLNVKDECTGRTSLEDIQKDQLITFEENKLYTSGTTGLLELLVRYRYITTEKAIIATSPDICVFRNSQASIIPKDLEDNYYDNTRSVKVMILFKDGFVAFDFTQKIITA